MTSATQINEMIAAGNQWLGKANELAADRLAHQQAYAALAGNLKAVVSTELDFSGTVDPDDLAPTGENGGTFTSFRDLVNAAPNGASVNCYLAVGKVHVLSAILYSTNKTVRFRKSGVGANPVIRPMGYVSGAFNYVNNIQSRGGSLSFEYVDIDLALVKANVALPWNSAQIKFVQSAKAGHTEIGLEGCTVTGTDNASIAGCLGGATVTLGLRNCALDGDIVGLNNISEGVATVAQMGTTTANGAAVYSDGALGTNLISN